MEGAQLLAGHSGEAQQVVHQLARVARRVSQRGQGAALVGVQLRAGGGVQHLGETGHLAQRRAQVMADRVGEALQLAVGGAEGLGAFFHPELERGVELANFLFGCAQRLVLRLQAGQGRLVVLGQLEELPPPPVGQQHGQPQHPPHAAGKQHSPHPGGGAGAALAALLLHRHQAVQLHPHALHQDVATAVGDGRNVVTALQEILPLEVSEVPPGVGQLLHPVQPRLLRLFLPHQPPHRSEGGRKLGVGQHQRL